LGRRGEYRPPNGGAGSEFADIKSLFSDPNVAWPKRAHWWHYVEENETFALWLLNSGAGSYTTAIEQARALARFLDVNGWSLDEFTDLGLKERRMLERKLEVFARRMESQGYKRGTINNYFKAVRSWLKYNDVELTRRIKLSRSESKREMVPSPEDVALILRGSGLRQAVCVGCVAYGGLRTEVLGQPKVYDGLRLGAFPDLDLGKLEFTQVPAMVFVRTSLSKIRLPYRTFVPEATCRSIVEYLRIRRERNGEELSRDSPLVAVEDGWVERGFRVSTSNRHVRSKTISEDIRNAIGGLGNWRPYDLRHFFMTWLKMAVARGSCSEGYRIYWAGQRGKTADVYDLYKDNIPEAIVDDMREQYRQAQPYLLPREESPDMNKMRLQLLVDFAKLQGFPEDKIALLKEQMNRSKSFEEGLQTFRKMEETHERRRRHP